ncbi:malto-oligosyltrehalose synthase [Herbaspirillum sp. YR522]|uniref:malto-oligosyltrehalose synthase n=1 Tax=Herbaspirillum sp. YR522 TaxID=1144342 RepID=UPI00026F53FA|nr:malto-oligosyltrehalose synthase [Herbaspirillum sp. YR522]EJM98628.1 malto-oligosyltrehalose synthase [Herbaspirillum sp. YR522]
MKPDSQAVASSGVPRATARLQLHQDFRFEHACALVDYYDALGISHLYASPILTARPGSTHGYDVVDPTRVNPELGGEKGLRELCGLLHQRGMGLIVDIVPNHMAVGRDNPWWQDVLRWGRRSRYAEWFDIDWDSPDPALAGKLCLPFLGRPYGEALAAGELCLRLDAAHGQLAVAHHDNIFPLSPSDVAGVLDTAGSPILAPAIAAFGGIGEDHGQAERQAAIGWQLLRELAADDRGRAAIDAALAAFAPDTATGQAALHALLERQHYRLAFWRNAADEINWRRFFEVSELVGVRVEREDVFEELHREIFRLYADGLIDGVRLDHIDGLTDPAGYCLRLRQRLRALRPGHVPYIIAEKILAPHETLPAAWQLDGTTGYEFMDQCAAVLHDGEGEPVLDELWNDIVDEARQQGATVDRMVGTLAPRMVHFDEMVRSARRSFLTRNFAAEFNALAACLHRLARACTGTRDLSLMALRRSLAELLVQFPVYRTYGGAEGMSEHDRQVLDGAVQQAAATLHASDHAALRMIRDWMAGDILEDATERALQLRAMARLQQLTPPLTAKSVEDTAFYRYGRLISRNEVGSHPDQLSLSVQDFHQLGVERARHAPSSMLATGTHDHKRGEDGRMRLAALSEIAEEWHTLLMHWRAQNAPVVAATAGAQGGIDAIDECMLYQTLVGAWRDGMQAADDDLQALQQLAERVVAWQRKAQREAKRRSDWVVPQEEYEMACERFVRALLCDPGLDARHHPFLVELEGFVRRLAPLGALNSLSQTLLKLTVPGVPDLYQGAEMWDLSLVDPDNRRPVDFALRQQRLSDVRQRPVSLRDWHDGGAKLQLIRAVLDHRRQHAELFARGDYLPLAVQGKLARHVIAFARVLPASADAPVRVAIVVCSRLAAHLLAFDAPREDSLPLVPVESWGNTCIVVPASIVGTGTRRWRSVLTSGHGALEGGPDTQADLQLLAGEVLGSLPVELLELHD